MAEPVIIVKENPGSLRIEVYDENGNQVLGQTVSTVPFRASDSDLDVDGSKFKAKRNAKYGDCVEIKVKTPSS